MRNDTQMIHDLGLFIRFADYKNNTVYHLPDLLKIIEIEKTL